LVAQPASMSRHAAVSGAIARYERREWRIRAPAARDKDFAGHWREAQAPARGNPRRARSLTLIGAGAAAPASQA
jgi:hypothetical protein